VNRTSNTNVLANKPSARAARVKAREDKIFIQSLFKDPEVPDEIVIQSLLKDPEVPDEIVIQSLLKDPEVSDEIVIPSLLKEPEVPHEIVRNELNEPSVERNEMQEIIEKLKKKMYVY